MISFKEYLIESKKVYEFKIKVAGELDKDDAKKLKLALDRYKVDSCSPGKRLPIQESPSDFPEHKNTNVTLFDVCLAYPTNSVQVRNLVAEKLNLPLTCVVVRSTFEEAEIAINHANDEKSNEALLTKDYETDGKAQNLVGEKQKMNLLKELSKTSHNGEQYKGVNDELLAKAAPAEKKTGPAEAAAKSNTKSPLGSSKVKLPTAGDRK